MRTICLLIALALVACGKDDPKIATRPDTGTRPDVGRDSAELGEDASAEPDTGQPAIIVTTEGGPVEGTERIGVRAFLGIPYAAPPLGELRFRPPVDHAGWTETLDASQYGEQCPQIDPNTDLPLGDEDCLTLNVWSPVDADSLPVMVFIHGGGFVYGAGSLPVYSGYPLAERGTVIVTLNYRLGALGFLAHEALVAESADDTAGNYGLLDQQRALKWIRDNIAAFGGDASNVTVFGESAGGSSICGHLGSPGSDGLFDRAIIQSGGGCGNYPLLQTGTLQNDPAVMVGASFVAGTDCDTADDVAACLRTQPVNDLLRAQHALPTSALGIAPFGLNIDGKVLPTQPNQRFRNGEEHDIPILTGANADEATIFTAAVPVPSVTRYEQLVRSVFGVTVGDQLLDAYPAADFDSPKDAYNTMFSDVVFICPAIRFAEDAAGGAHPSYVYHFTHSVDVGPTASLGSFHGLELLYVFGTLRAVSPLYPPTSADDVVAEAMQADWVSFATTGQLPWNGYDQAAPTYKVYRSPTAVVDEIRAGRCDVLRDLGITD